MKSYRSHFCHTAVAVLRQYFRVQIHDFSSLKNCHQSDTGHFMKLSSTFPSYESSRTPFPCPSSLMSLPALAMSKVPTKPRGLCPAHSGVPPGFPGRAVTWSCCGILPHQSVTEMPQGCGTVLHQRQQKCLKLNHRTQLGS